jgi:hypothetical protein
VCAHGVRLAALAAIALSACGPPSRWLTPRVVEDPIVLPKRMASVSTEISYVHYEPTNFARTFGAGALRIGLTNRLEWFGLIGLRFAILDDRPADGRAPMPFSLAIHAGVMGIGYSSLNGMIMEPVASVSALKHVADRWALSLGLDWGAGWVQRRFYPLTPAYSGSLGYSSQIRSTFTLRGTVMRQLSERIALGISPRVAQTNDCIDPRCGWVSQSASGSVFVSARPWDWLTVGLGPAVGVRHRPDAVLPTTFPGGTPIYIPPTRVTWVEVSGWATFYW